MHVSALTSRAISGPVASCWSVHGQRHLSASHMHKLLLDVILLCFLDHHVPHDTPSHRAQQQQFLSLVFVKFSSCNCPAWAPSLCSHSTRCVCKVLVVEIRSLMRHMTRVKFSMVGFVDRALPAPAHKQCRHRARPISLFQLSDGEESGGKPATPSEGVWP